MPSQKKGKIQNELNPRTTEYEFLGPPGAFLITFGVPLTVYALFFGCSESSGGCPPPLASIPERFTTALSDCAFWSNLWDTQAALIYLAWYAFCVVAWTILPGDWVEGVTMRTGEKKKYKINAFSTFLLALGLAVGYIYRNGPQSFTFLYEKWVGFVTASLVMSVAQGLAVYVGSFRKGALLALGGNSGNFIYDFYIGRELNPSIGSFDIKSFNELRPGLILWTLVNISMACEQTVRTGGVSDAMWLVLLFQGWYVADGLYNEPAILTTMDITTDGFGFMLSVGDLTWVPFVYSLQARFLVFRPVELGSGLYQYFDNESQIPRYLGVLSILFVNALGYWIFREANGEKNDFRNGKNPKNLQYFTTESGSKLLTTGWWGRSRHPNYFGDLVMALAWSLPTGFTTPVTYFYVVYFTVLLVHRQRRDEEACEKKYGKDWAKYKKMVPYRIIPYVY
ncbi:hypothetical protein SERLA73DRAFT_187724 [Serpula lacrymans var. lacrymans S7.3]|uniref:Delta(14)-sterol reductase n=2 Tax=Serpula lacrymans var. lacrymans TaxID=341189 RepID=F8QA85_SERL3|nr:uncharacterized protein SERLADRAFT_477485 [Serpula lacrymans var. lacrymans S7.9]EGN94675.1 hypothetical protein SERLA73DRAFT_187724 [Serpula lacrymans var. lacrymans S7.3]EGO20157.1 hypothetical protein SERLADRAFT_477485 [Serpula lacrymans var. lacrymans S7.9]